MSDFTLPPAAPLMPQPTQPAPMAPMIDPMAAPMAAPPPPPMPPQPPMMMPKPKPVTFADSEGKPSAVTVPMAASAQGIYAKDEQKEANKTNQVGEALRPDSGWGGGK